MAFTRRWMHRPRPAELGWGNDFHRDDFHTYPSSRRSGATFVPRCSCTVSGAGCSRHRIPPQSANVFMHLASPWAGARHGCVRLVIRVNVRILNVSWWMIVMGGHERPSVLLPVNLSDLSISSSSFSLLRETICCARCYKIEYNTTRYLVLIFRKIDFTGSSGKKYWSIYYMREMERCTTKLKFVKFTIRKRRKRGIYLFVSRYILIIYNISCLP